MKEYQGLTQETKTFLKETGLEPNEKNIEAIEKFFSSIIKGYANHIIGLIAEEADIKQKDGGSR